MRVSLLISNNEQTMRRPYRASLHLIYSKVNDLLFGKRPYRASLHLINQRLNDQLLVDAHVGRLYIWFNRRLNDLLFGRRPCRASLHLIYSKVEWFILCFLLAMRLLSQNIGLFFHWLEVFYFLLGWIIFHW